MMNQFEKDSKRYEREPLVVNANLEVGEKIDIYKQLHLNWDAFCDYVYNCYICTQRHIPRSISMISDHPWRLFQQHSNGI